METKREDPGTRPTTMEHFFEEAAEQPIPLQAAPKDPEVKEKVEAFIRKYGYEFAQFSEQGLRPDLSATSGSLTRPRAVVRLFAHPLERKSMALNEALLKRLIETPGVSGREE